MHRRIDARGRGRTAPSPRAFPTRLAHDETLVGEQRGRNAAAVRPADARARRSTPSGCAANGSARVSSSRGGGPSSRGRPRCPAAAPTSASRLPTAAAPRRPDARSRKRASRRGTKYLAVLTMPIVSAPACDAPQARHRVLGVLERRQHPPGVDQQVLAGRGQRDLRGRRDRTAAGRPRSSSSLICIETAGGVRCSSSAARAKLRCRATAAKTRSCRMVTFTHK